jgi:hypothetical protein
VVVKPFVIHGFLKLTNVTFAKFTRPRVRSGKSRRVSVRELFAATILNVRTTEVQEFKNLHSIHDVL